MDNSEVEENLLAIGEPKLHTEMCKSLCAIYAKVLEIFPELEAARPRSTSGIQALCALHIALEKTKNVLQHCAECSKLYLAITGDSVVLKFEKARLALEDGLRRVEDIVPQTIGSQIAEILCELLEIKFSLDPVEKQIGVDIIELLQQGKQFSSNSSDNNELESFHQAASGLGITSSRAALRERRALKKLLEKAQSEEDKRKESIVAFLSHLMRKYSKLFRSDLSDDNDSQGGSTPCSPTIQGQFDPAFDRQLSKLCSFNFKPNFRKSGQIPIPPEELRCPISLQLMFDPVIIASGQTYERICIEKWFSDGHNTCPKSQQHLPHLTLTPNYCVKGLVASWCEQNGVPVPDGPPESLDLNYWRLALSDNEHMNSNSNSKKNNESHKSIDSKIVPLEDSGTIEEDGHDEYTTEDISTEEKGFSLDDCESYDDLLTILKKENDMMKLSEVIDRIRHLLKDNDEARTYMGENGLVITLLHFLDSALNCRYEKAQEIGAMALFNLAVNNNRNKETMLEGGILPLLERMVTDFTSTGPATALYLNLSCLEEAKPVIGSTKAVPFLINVLESEDDTLCRLDALHALYNLSICLANVPYLLEAGVINGLQSLITRSNEHSLTEKCIAVLINIALSKSAREEIASSPGLISGLATVLDVGEPVEQEQAAACLLILCNGNENCSQMVLQEGVIPSLVSISVNGTLRGKQKAQKLLMLFRQQRQREAAPPPPPHIDVNLRPENEDTIEVPFCSLDTRPLSKSISRRKVTKALSFWRKNKSFSAYQC